MKPEHWEPPDPPKLLISARRVAEELDIPVWKANEVCWALDRRFYAPGQAHFKVTKRSFDALKRLVEQDITIRDAKAVVAYFRRQGELPPENLDDETAKRIAWGTRQRWWR